MRAPLSAALVAIALGACGGAEQASPAAQPGAGQPAGSAAGRAIDPPAEPGSLAPRLARGESGELLMTWVEPDPAGGHRIRFARRARGGWSAPVTIASGPRVVASPVDAPAIAAAGGALLASHAERPSGGGGGDHAQDVVLSRSADGGATWTRLGTPHRDGTATEHGFFSLIPRGFAVWLDGRATATGGPTALRTAAASPPGAEQVLDDRVCDCCPTATATTELGPIVVYRDRGEDEVRDISIVRQVDGAWTAPAAVHRDGWRIEGCPVNGPAVAARGREVVVAWYTRAGDAPRVLVAFSRDGGASFEPPAVVDAAQPDGRAPAGQVDVALDSGPTAIVSWLASRGEGSQVLVRRAAPGGGLGSVRALAAAPASRRAGIPRIASTEEGLVLAWTAGGEATRVRALAIAPREIASVAQAPAGAMTAARPEVGATVGRAAPDYRASGADGRAVTLADHRGEVVLLNLWATWCAPCKKEMPELAELHRRYQTRGLRVIAVSLDAPEARERALEYVAAEKFPFAVWLDPDDRATQVLAAPSLPVTLVLDRRGTIVFRRDGTITAADAELVGAIEEALAAR